MARIALAALALAAPLLGGCGTVKNLSHGTPENWGAGSEVYGGARWDLALGAGMIGEALTPKDTGAWVSKPTEFVWGASLLTLDLPLSLVADSVTLPVVIWADLRERYGSSDRPEPARGTGQPRGGLGDESEGIQAGH